MEDNIIKKLELDYLLQEDNAQAISEEEVFFALVISSTTGKGLTLFDLEWLTNFLNESK